jgi:hypothetical protein
MTETTTVTVEAGKAEDPLGWIKLNPNYFKTPPGMVKLAQLVRGSFQLTFK